MSDKYPKIIYLQDVGDEITWCADEITDKENGIVSHEYIRKDVANQTVANQSSDLARLRELLREVHRDALNINPFVKPELRYEEIDYQAHKELMRRIQAELKE